MISPAFDLTPTDGSPKWHYGDGDFPTCHKFILINFSITLLLMPSHANRLFHHPTKCPTASDRWPQAEAESRNVIFHMLRIKSREMLNDLIEMFAVIISSRFVGFLPLTHWIQPEKNCKQRAWGGAGGPARRNVIHLCKHNSFRFLDRSEGSIRPVANRQAGKQLDKKRHVLQRPPVACMFGACNRLTVHRSTWLRTVRWPFWSMPAMATTSDPLPNSMLDGSGVFQTVTVG